MPVNPPQPQTNPYDAIAPPDFSADFHATVRAALIANGTAADDAVAAESLLATWKEQHEQSRVQWNAEHPQPDEPQGPEGPHQPGPQQAEPNPHHRAPNANEVDNLNDDRDDGAFPSIDKSEPVPSCVGPVPPQACIARLRELKHVDLWYFTVEACADAARVSCTDDRMISLEKDDITGALTLKDSARPGKKPIADTNLDWEQMTSGKALFLQYLEIVRWPKNYIIMFMEFFFKLENHPLRYEKPETGKRALLRYQAVTCHKWHDSLTLMLAKKKKKIWDIATLNEKLLTACVQIAEQAEASRLRTDLMTMQYQLNEGIREFRKIRDRSSRPPEYPPSEGKRGRSPSFSDNVRFPPNKRAMDSSHHFRDDSESIWVCILYLSTEPHNKAKCTRSTFVNGDRTRCSRDGRNRIINPQGNVICIEFNRRGCPSSDPKHVHECSGCGSPSHGAQSCRLVLKK